jgi:hypothetical protein
MIYKEVQYVLAELMLMMVMITSVVTTMSIKISPLATEVDLVSVRNHHDKNNII